MSSDMYTVVPYRYRDTSNNKDEGVLVLRGVMSPQVREEIRGCLSDEAPDSSWFVPQQVDVDTLGVPQENYGDLWWHELLLDEMEIVESPPHDWPDRPVCDGGDVEQFRDRMVAASGVGWDASLDDDA